jgi:hypothetical protein
MIRSTLQEFLNSSYAPRRLIGRAPETLGHYRNAIRHLERFLGRAASVEDLTETAIAGLMSHLMAAGGSPAI